MEQNLLTQHIVNKEVLKAQLKALVELDQRLVPIFDQVGEVPLRLGKPGFAGLAPIVSGQLLSVASARAIHTRVETLVGEMSAKKFLAVETEALRAAGLSWSKIHCLCGVAQAELSGTIDFEALHLMNVSEAVEKLTAVKGIGPWSAQIYLMSSVAHPDIFPAGDLVLQKMLGKILGKTKKPDEKQTSKLAKKWSPYRGAAARLLWRYFAVLRDREGINL
ncbi:DNA-3-methyladenine glycosylase II [hydrothermal vent metagenome]|uniref:DNA-3-methyladenine glycosylase II n=1 Tax=hydrothermal vent metagenome TaxID=652676 RepID=A0A3B0TMD2_9ZZZZ